MHIEELVQKIVPVNQNLIKNAQQHFDNLIKPVGSLAQLETMTSRYAAIIGSVDKEDLENPVPGVLLLLGNSASGKQLERALGGRDAAVVVARQVDVVTAPVFITGEQPDELLEEGAMLAAEYTGEEQARVLLLGSLNPAPQPQVWEKFLTEPDPYFFLERVQDPLVTALTGAILQGAGQKLPLLLDGASAFLAAVAACKFNPVAADYCFASHVSVEPGLEILLDFLKLTAPLRLNLPGGSGVGAAACLTLLKAGVKAYKEMETFEEAGVHKEEAAFSLQAQQKKHDS